MQKSIIYIATIFIVSFFNPSPAHSQIRGYSSYVTSPDGSDVACGGKFTGTATSPDGKKVCAGGWNLTNDE